MTSDRVDSADGRILWWEPGGVLTTMWVTLAILLALLTVMTLGMLYSLFGAATASQELTFSWIAMVVLTPLILAAHQLIHALVARLTGANPQLDVDVLQWMIPVMYCRPGDHLFTRSQFLLYALAPLGILTLIGILLLPLDSRSVWLIVPLALNSSLSTRDVWTAWLALKLPTDSLIRIERDGLRLFLPS